MTQTTLPRCPRPRRALLAACAALVLAGCASPPPPAVLLTLPPAALPGAEAPPPAAAAAAPRVLALRRVDVPEYLASRRVRYRADASTLAEWPDTVWAERVEIAVSREFGAALQQALLGWRVCDAPCTEQAPALAAQVALTRLDFLRAEQRLLATARLAVWTTERVPRLLRSDDRGYVIPAAAATPQAQAEATTLLLRRVAADLAAMASAHTATN